MNARNMFYSNTDFSKAEEKAFAREDLIYNLTEDLLIVMESKGITKNNLARQMNKSKSYISQVLNGSRNMTLKTLSDMCFELNCHIQFKLTEKNLDENTEWNKVPSVLVSKKTKATQTNVIQVENSKWKKLKAA